MIDDENAIAKAEALRRYREKRNIFVETFGPPGQRTKHGQAILDELERFANYRKPIRVTDARGRTDIYATARMEGRREVLQALHDIIEWKEIPHVDPSSSRP
jgi:hypothetical protein